MNSRVVGRLRLSEVAHWLGVTASEPDAFVRGVCIDSRRVRCGDLFIALPGKQHDGHDFLTEAKHRGAVAAVVSRQGHADLCQLVVPDTVSALGLMARAWRTRFEIPLIAIAGSNGKTTVKEMLGAILHRATSAAVLVTHGNLNNEIGVPLTLLRMRERHRFAVIELGANHPGEIALLADLARPTLGLITNAGLDHIAGFGGSEGAARANGEMFAAMDDDAIAVLNADDPCFPIWEALANGRRIIGYSMLRAQADVQGSWHSTAYGGRLAIQSPWGAFDVELTLTGRHNGANALAAAAAALVLGLPASVIAAGLAVVQPIKGRMQPLVGLYGARLIDDSYNANPSSLHAALTVLADTQGERVLILGDMAELGEAAMEWHGQAGLSARAAGVTQLFALGALSQHAVDTFGLGARHFQSHEALASALRDTLHANVTALIKGSRCMQMEKLLDDLIANPSKRRNREPQ